MYLVFHISMLKLATSNTFLERTQFILVLVIIFLGQKFIILNTIVDHGNYTIQILKYKKKKKKKERRK